MNSQYGQAYSNPYATGSSSDAQIASMLQNLQNLSSYSNGQPAAPASIDPATSLKALGDTTALTQPSQSASAAPAVASALGGPSGGVAGATSSGLGALSGGGGALGKIGGAVGVLGGLADIYFGFQANKLAKKQFNFQKDAYNNNLTNTVQSYNTSLEDRINARHNTEGRSSGETASYLQNNRLQANNI